MKQLKTKFRDNGYLTLWRSSWLDYPLEVAVIVNSEIGPLRRDSLVGASDLKGSLWDMAS